MVFHMSSSDSKSTQVFWTLLSILADLHNAVVWVVSSSHFQIIQSLDQHFSVYTERIDYNWSHRHSQNSIVFFSFQARSRYLARISFSFNFILWSAGTAKSTIRQFLFFVDYHQVWSFDWDKVIYFYHKIPENFVRLIFQDGFWLAYIPFVRMVKS